VPTDADFLGLARDDDTGRFRFVVEEHLARMDARLYGGTAIAVSMAAAEEVTQRPTLWMTTQFVSTVGQGAPVDVDAEVLAPGRRTNQVRVTGTSADGATVFASLGATGHHRDSGLVGQFEHRPTVGPPDDSGRWESPFSALARAAGLPEPPSMPRDTGFTRVIELRGAPIIEHPDPGAGRVCVWVRRRDGQAITPALAAFMADMVPMSIAHALGVFAGGTSLDNTIRIGEFEQSEWVLLDLRPHGAIGDYGHGVAHVWSEGGRWMATASQTAALRRFDPQDAPWTVRPGLTP